jgi:hypothetical protein
MWNGGVQSQIAPTVKSNIDLILSHLVLNTIQLYIFTIQSHTVCCNYNIVQSLVALNTVHAHIVLIQSYLVLIKSSITLTQSHIFVLHVI